MKPLIFGHRGSPFEAPENTLLSIKKAIEAGIDAVEIDVQKTKDNALVVIHDDKVDRTTNGKGFVKNFTLKELKKLDAGEGQKIPTLQEAIDFVRNKIKLVIEIKQKNIERSVVALLEKNDFIENAYVISFYHGIVKKVKELNGKIKTGILFEGNPVNPVSLVRDAKADAIITNYDFIDRELVEKVHQKNFKVFVGDINTIENLTKILQLNVDGIGGDNLKLLVSYFRKQQTL